METVWTCHCSVGNVKLPANVEVLHPTQASGTTHTFLSHQKAFPDEGHTLVQYLCGYSFI